MEAAEQVPKIMLEHIFGSATRLKLLQLFCAAPERAYFVRELARMTDSQLNGIRRELANLEDIGMIKQVEANEVATAEVGTERSKYYRLNPSFMLLNELRALMVKARVMEEQNYIELIRKRAGDIKLFLLTGKFVNDSEIATDMLIVGDIKPIALARVMKDFEKFAGYPVRYTLMDKKEFADRYEIGDRFLYSILETKYMVVVDTGLLR